SRVSPLVGVSCASHCDKDASRESDRVNLIVNSTVLRGPTDGVRRRENTARADGNKQVVAKGQVPPLGSVVGACIGLLPVETIGGGKHQVCPVSRLPRRISNRDELPFAEGSSGKNDVSSHKPARPVQSVLGS